MHVYIYDDFVSTKKYTKELAFLETRLTDLGLNGKIIRLGNMKNIPGLIENELRLGAKTIVAVGDNATLNKTANAIINYLIKNDLSANPPLAIIPVGENNNSIAPILGIKNLEDGCDILAARRIEKIDVGKVVSYNTSGQTEKTFFINDAIIKNQGTNLEINKKFSIEVSGEGIIYIINLPLENAVANNITPDPTDGILELFIKTKYSKSFLKLNPQISQSLFSIKNLTVDNPKTPLILDNSLEINTPAEVSVLKKKINVIVGKERNF
ncbi:MAG: diacylglycerol kinase family protein [Patescibacteria group bacterium]|nr:diacylglycerol kinase family protein [Patescibacteria group bacterium]MDD4610699.1 diacylglycerol kinase family protein [Patescibacteria group bacterium]